MAQVTQLSSFMLAAALLLPGFASAHSASAVLDAAGGSASFTAFARVTCFNDGNGDAAYLMARVRDKSPTVAGLLVNLQVLRTDKGLAISISDRVSGDADYSDYVALNGGNGVYHMLLNKTAAGARGFDIEWHCMTAGNAHTGTEIGVLQFQ